MAEYFERDETVIVSTEITDSAGAKTDPTTIVIYVIDSAGTTQVDGVAMTKDATGEYHHDYTLPADCKLGIWDVRIKCTNDSRISIKDCEFYVVDGVM